MTATVNYTLEHFFWHNPEHMIQSFISFKEFVGEFETCNLFNTKTGNCVTFIRDRETGTQSVWRYAPRFFFTKDARFAIDAQEAIFIRKLCMVVHQIPLNEKNLSDWDQNFVNWAVARRAYLKTVSQNQWPLP